MKATVSLELVNRVPLLRSLPSNEKDALTALFTAEGVKRGKFVIRESSNDSTMYFIVSGRVKVCRADSHGKEVIVAILGPGEYFGEIALLAGTPRTTDVVALIDCELLCLSGKDFIEHVEKYNGLTFSLLRGLANRLHTATSRITDLALYDVTCRVARVLMEMSKVSAVADQHLPVVEERPTHQDLAAMVGSSREVVTRALKALEDEGHIEIEDERIVILSMPRF